MSIASSARDYTFEELVAEASMRRSVGSEIGQPWTAHAWPGGYTVAYICDDGEILCSTCMDDLTNSVHFTGNNDGWRIIQWIAFGVNIDYPNEDVHCVHCNKIIEEGGEG